MQKPVGFMIEENFRHEGTWHEDPRKAEDVQKWSTFAEFPAGAVYSTLHIQPKQPLRSAQVLKKIISVPALRQTALHDSEIADGDASTKCPPGPAQ